MNRSWGSVKNESQVEIPARDDSSSLFVCGDNLMKMHNTMKTMRIIEFDDKWKWMSRL